jgi:hypothetical protein
MTRPALEVADIFRAHGDSYLSSNGPSISPQQRTVMRRIADCRTPALGGHVLECDRCGHREVSYNSCRDRHCPKCQAAGAGKWLEARVADLLAVPEYFHVVFTLPDEIAPLALQNKALVYGLLFKAAWESLHDLAGDPKHLGGDIGCHMVLHTWGQNLLAHPHVHCVIPGGALSPDRSRWIPCRPGFFLPVRPLGRLFRGKFLALLNAAFKQGRLSFHGQLKPLGEPDAFAGLLSTLRRKPWVVYSKPPFAGPEVVLKYLARYTHRVAISNSRLLSLDDGKVAFRWKDYAHGHREKTMTVDAHEFIRRFLLHLLPSGFVRIRHFGFLSNRSRKTLVPLCRTLLGQEPTAHDPEPNCSAESESESDGEYPPRKRCPACNRGRMSVVEDIPRQPTHHALAIEPACANSS